MAVPTDPYLLRNLIRCAEHDLGMTCSLPIRDIMNRVYRCPARDCWTGTIHAAGIEGMAWRAAEQKATLRDVQPEFRRAALEALLDRVIVGGDPKIRYVWRTWTGCTNDQ
ncbi:hypothetical protein [Micromonospora zhanjiangensis]|uniref:Uncharacterized protein n=1 Tax=Micromonospora zhanjiangensis TaxID=1522057 RepID=A0ABV8KXG4_9ACTN